MNSFINGVESLNTSLLLAVQRLAKTAETSSKESSIEGNEFGINETGPGKALFLQFSFLTSSLIAMYFTPESAKVKNVYYI